MSRVTDKQVHEAFALFCRDHGFRVAKAYNDVGAYRLDYASCYGGYNIERITSETGGVTHPFGGQRRRAREMADMLYFGQLIAEVAR